MLSVGKTLISLPLEPLAKYPATLSGGKLVPGPLRTYYLVPRAYDLIGQQLGSYLKKRKPGGENKAGEPWDENGVAGRSGKAEIKCTDC